ncbi:hypothetical protein BCR44DRAFT_307933 [Catenaria anguillulae PL171]|uniref:Uncharacterized protein n=1 Tax=Catenaria anguillulae PL171 TaxID=765915 RepID=A0A1Y2HWQ9_9FUNG|nr:hypothetical protein BCR44DRAFT_307933 [Catenaria anguillulae PL171]
MFRDWMKVSSEVQACAERITLMVCVIEPELRFFSTFSLPASSFLIPSDTHLTLLLSGARCERVVSMCLLFDWRYESSILLFLCNIAFPLHHPNSHSFNTGINQTAHDNTTHCYPLAFPYDMHNGQVRAADPPVNARVVPWRLPPAVHYQPGDLPLRADPIYQAHLDDMAQAENNQAQEDIGKAIGLNGTAAFWILEFCKNPFLYAIADPFHLLCENVIPNLWKISAGSSGFVRGTSSDTTLAQNTRL